METCKRKRITTDVSRFVKSKIILSQSILKWKSIRLFIKYDLKLIFYLPAFVFFSVSIEK